MGEVLKRVTTRVIKEMTLQEYCLDLMHIPRWRLRSESEQISNEALTLTPLRAVASPAFISIVSEKTLDQEAIALANAIAKACGVLPENHLILSTAQHHEAQQTRADFLPGKEYSGFIVLFGVPVLSWKNDSNSSKTVETFSLAVLAKDPLAKKQLWKTLQAGINVNAS